MRQAVQAWTEDRVIELPTYRNFTKEDIKLVSEMIAKGDFSRLLSLLQDKEDKKILFEILQDTEKSHFLFSMIRDSKFLTGR